LYKTAQMKTLTQATLVLFLIAGLFSCTKTTGVEKAQIIGKWGIKNDSLASGIGPNVTVKNYLGTAADYFDFRADNKLYIKEGTTLDTSAYKVLSDSTIVINSFGITFNGVPQTSKIKSPTANSVTIFTPFAVNPGAYYLRTVNLRR
jgi:hypothetical protein